MSSSDFIPELPQDGPALKRVKTRSYATGRTIMALILREMSTRYGRTPGGYIWAVLEPMGMILILSFGFSLMMRSPSLGTSFILFYATGYLPFNLYQSSSAMVSRAVLFSKALLQYPAVTWIDAILARFLLNTLTAVLVGYILLAAILSVVDTRVIIDFGPILAAAAMAALLGLGIGTLNCVLMGMVPTWDVVWSILTRPLFLGSAVIYIMEDLPRSVQNILWYNPLTHITGLMRSGFFPTYNPDYVSPVYVVGIALCALVLGIILMQRYHLDIINN